MRGIAVMQCPTSLLAQVDASVGGKTAVNHPGGKNLIGAFYQPACVIADVATFATLPQREVLAGVAEVIKYGVIYDAEFFAWLEAHLDALVAGDADTLDIRHGEGLGSGLGRWTPARRTGRVRARSWGLTMDDAV